MINNANKRYDFHSHQLIKFPVEYIEFVDYVTDMGLSINKIIRTDDTFDVYFNKQSDPEIFVNNLFGIVQKSISKNIGGKGNCNWIHLMEPVFNEKHLTPPFKLISFIYIIKHS